MNQTSARGAMAGTLYDLLEVSPRASGEVIRAAYHVLAQNWHPDVSSHPDAVHRMSELNAAYAVLSDSARRADYDAKCALSAHASRRQRAGSRYYHRRSEPRPIELPTSRRPISLLGRTAIVVAITMVVATVFFAFWAVLDSLDDGFTRPVQYSGSRPGLPIVLPLKLSFETAPEVAPAPALGALDDPRPAGVTTGQPSSL
jgi:curved DNA-binding protein CbpA